MTSIEINKKKSNNTKWKRWIVAKYIFPLQILVQIGFF